MLTRRWILLSLTIWKANWQWLNMNVTVFLVKMMLFKMRIIHPGRNYLIFNMPHKLKEMPPKRPSLWWNKMWRSLKRMLRKKTSYSTTTRIYQKNHMMPWRDRKFSCSTLIFYICFQSHIALCSLFTFNWILLSVTVFAFTFVIF